MPPPQAELRRPPDPVQTPKGVVAPWALIAEEEYWRVVQPEARVDPEERVRGIEQKREQLEASYGPTKCGKLSRSFSLTAS